MTRPEDDDIATVRAYLAALQDGATGEALARWYTPDALQVEWPNRLNPGGGRSDLATLLRRAERVPALLREQRYEVRSAIARDGRVAIEATWSAGLATGFGDVPQGAALKAHFAMFFELRDGRIARQHNYDCFEPW